jgi:hypothetical protein
VPAVCGLGSGPVDWGRVQPATKTMAATKARNNTLFAMRRFIMPPWFTRAHWLK